MLTSKVPFRRVDLPHEPGEWVELRILSGLQLQHARAAAQHDAVIRMREMGAELVQSTVNLATAEERAAANAENANDPLRGYDRRTLLIEGICDWSYSPEPVTPENIDDLDEETMQFLALELLPKVRTEADLKNDFGPSTPTSTDNPV